MRPRCAHCGGPACATLIFDVNPVEHYCAPCWMLVYVRSCVRGEVAHKRYGDWMYTTHTADNLAYGKAQEQFDEAVWSAGVGWDGNWEM